MHDWVAGREGDHREALDALHAARALGLEVTVWTRLTRSNARALAELPSLIKARGARAWLVVLPVAAEVPEPFTAVVPRLGLSLPAALAAIEAARRRGLDARIRGAPRCVLGRFADRAAPSPARAYAVICEGCPSRASCPGVDPEYLALFGEGELRPAPDLAPAPWAPFEGRA